MSHGQAHDPNTGQPYGVDSSLQHPGDVGGGYQPNAGLDADRQNYAQGFPQGNSQFYPAQNQQSFKDHPKQT